MDPDSKHGKYGSWLTHEQKETRKTGLDMHDTVWSKRNNYSNSQHAKENESGLNFMSRPANKQY